MRLAPATSVVSAIALAEDQKTIEDLLNKSSTVTKI
jgi:hypothetical protein